MEWDYDQLWNKAILWAQKAHEQDKGSTDFPLMCAICLEILARATLAYVHPALLADPLDGENIMYVFGFSQTKQPKSIPIKTVFERCHKIVDKFTQAEIDFCMNMMYRRNQELHSGSNAFEDFPIKYWQYDFYRVLDLMLKSLNKGFDDLLSREEALMAKEMISEEFTKVQNGVKQLIGFTKDEFYRKSEEERKELIQNAIALNFVDTMNSKYIQEVKCPACGQTATISGELTKIGDPVFRDDRIVRQISVLPTKLVCYVCELRLNGYNKLHAAGYGGYFTIDEDYEPMDYFDFDPSDSYEYGND